MGLSEVDLKVKFITPILDIMRVEYEKTVNVFVNNTGTNFWLGIEAQVKGPSILISSEININTFRYLKISFSLFWLLRFIQTNCAEFEVLDLYIESVQGIEMEN